MSQASVYKVLKKFQGNALSCKQIAKILELNKSSVVSSLNRLIKRREIDMYYLQENNKTKYNKPVYKLKEGRGK